MNAPDTTETGRSRSFTGATGLTRTPAPTGPLAHLWGPGYVWGRDVAWPIFEPWVVRVRDMAGIVTGLGWGLAASAVGALALGMALGWRELVTASMVGTAALLIALGFLLGRMEHEASLDLSRSRIVVGERAVGAIEVVNRTRRQQLPVTVELPVGRGLATFQVPRLGPGEKHEDLFTIPTTRRAVLTVGPVSAVRGDPLGLMARIARWTQPVELFVHPRTVGLDGSSAGILQDLEGLPSKDLTVADVSFHAIRDYVRGDDRRHVHWKSTARIGKLMVRQFEETRRSHLAVVLSLRGDEYQNDDQFELAISVAGSLGLQALREEKQLTMLVQGAQLPTRRGKALLDALSGLDYTPGHRGGLAELALEAGMKAPDASAAVLVCGPQVEPAQLRRAASHIPAGVTVIAVYCQPGAIVTRRMIGDVIVLTIGDLHEIPHAMRRVVA